MEQKNSQGLNKKKFSDLIYDPSAISADDSEILEGLVQKYPYSQLIRSFYARSLVSESVVSFEKELAKTALFSPDRNILRSIIENAESLKSTDVSSPVSVEETGEKGLVVTEELIKEAEINNAKETESIRDATQDLPDAETDITETSISVEDIHAADQSEEPRAEEIETILTAEPDSTDNDLYDIPDDLSESEIHEQQDLASSAVSDLASTEEPAGQNAPEQEQETDELDQLIKENAVPADFLKDEKIHEPIEDTTESVFTPEMDMAENISHHVTVENDKKVSRYDDDKMPYSFLWWLSKTRKEYSDNYQPYVSFQLDTSQSIKRNSVDQLSSQIIENIFHLQSPVDQFENAPRTVPFQVKRKEDYILEKFIREEPQIKPPNSDKLDTENKARKSAEDPNDLVSETLAQIYTDQMLFHKAIDTYKKLSLKFPEKSTYFADQIRELEKKIN